MTGEPDWGRTIDDLIAADLAGAVVFHCVGCGVSAGDEHEPDCTEVAAVSVRKVVHVVQMSIEACGLAPHRPPYTPTWRQRFRWWREDRVRRARMRVASWLAGFDVEDRW